MEMLTREQAISKGRLKQLRRLHDEHIAEWRRAENAEAERDAARDSLAAASAGYDRLAKALQEIVAQLVWCENPHADDLESVRYALQIAREALGDPR